MSGANSNKLTLPMPLWEFVGMMAALMSLNALAIDTMLPALGVIAEYYQLEKANDQQLVLFAYILGFGAPQLIFGPVSDRYGRRGLLLICLFGYVITAFISMSVASFSALLLIRFFQGVLASGIRVIAVSVVRDLMAGRAMARVMSLIMTVFMIVPILAPAIGQGIMAIAPWQWTFGVLGLGGMIMMVWVFFRLPESLPPDRRKPLDLPKAFSTYRQVLETRMTLGYMAASGVIFGALFAFIGASEQIFDDVFGQGDRFALYFASIAGALAIANLLNARIVEKVGMRKISHTVLFIFIGLSLLNIGMTLLLGEKLIIFLPLFALTFGCFGMLGANFSAIAMEPQGENAGTASAAYGFATTTFASFFGWIVASRFDGSIVPILFGYFGLGVLSLLLVFITERGQLFEPAQSRR